MAWGDDVGTTTDVSNISGISEMVEWQPEASIIDYTSVPAVVGVLVTVVGAIGCFWAFALARLLDLTVVRPLWTQLNLPCENVLYFMFSVAVADLLQAGCVLTRGVQMVCRGWILNLAFCKLWHLLDAVACSVRLWILLLANGNLLLRDGRWSRPVKVSLVSAAWLLVTASTFVVMRVVGLRRNGVCGVCHLVNVPAAAVWRHVTTDAPALLLLPAATVVYLWFRWRSQDGAASADGDLGLDVIDGPSEEKSAAPGGGRLFEQQALGANSATTKNTPQAPASTNADSASSQIGLQSQRSRKLQRTDTYTPSTFTLSKFWGMPTVDEMSSASGFTDLATRDGDLADLATDLEMSHRQDLSPQTAAKVQHRVRRCVLVISLAHAAAAALAGAVRAALDWALAREPAWQMTILVLDMASQLQPLITALIFTVMFPRMCHLLRQ